MTILNNQFTQTNFDSENDSPGVERPEPSAHLAVKKRSVLVLGDAFPLTGGIASVIQDQFNSSLSKSFRLNLFDTRKRTRVNRTVFEGIASQIILLVTYTWKLLITLPDIVHIHAGGGSDIFRKGWDVALAKIFRRRVLLHIHGGDFNEFFEPGNQRKLKRIQRIFGKCDGVIALSEYWRSLYARILRDDAIHVVNNCVDLDAYTTVNRTGARQALDLPESAPVVIHLGAQGKRKGTFDIVRAMPVVLDAVPETIAIMVGPDENVHPGAINEARALAEELGISDSIRFLGARTGKQKIECLGAADLFVLPSYNENFPISILEAMACGLPIVSTRVGGIPEMLCDGPSEDLIEPGDIEALSGRIRTFVSNSGLRNESGRRNLAVARERFDLEVFARELGKAYDALCNK